jgi:signal transduction histidine kinase
MGQIVDRTLNSARIDEGRIELRRERVDLVELMREIGQRQEATSSGFEIAIASAAPSLEVDADRQLLDQVFTNLLSNAVKYSAASRHVDVALAVDGGNVRVTVRDFGVGIPAHELPRLFTRFYRASTAQGISGTGIGLSLVKDLLAMHGGSVSATSRVGEGSVFVVTLPMSSAAALGARSA